MTTVHAMTNDQETLDIPHKKGIKARRGRAKIIKYYSNKHRSKDHK